MDSGARGMREEKKRSRVRQVHKRGRPVRSSEFSGPFIGLELNWLSNHPTAVCSPGSRIVTRAAFGVGNPIHLFSSIISLFVGRSTLCRGFSKPKKKKKTFA